ncbi:MAG: type II secretion system protein [Phycisphaerales bacterium]
MRSRAFTLIELLVVIGVTAILIGLLLPALRGASQTSRVTTSCSNLRQIGTALTSYLNNNNNHLPQVTWDVGGGNEVIIATLFGGKRGTLPAFGIDQIGADRRPLNRYLASAKFDPDEEVPIFESPLDRGGPLGPGAATNSMYDALGTSYALNDHSLNGDADATLIPSRSADGTPGGRMPRIKDPTKTWVLGEHPIYNYQEGGDRGLRWYDGSEVRACLWFMDGHTLAGAHIPEGIENTTDDYTFLP